MQHDKPHDKQRNHSADGARTVNRRKRKKHNGRRKQQAETEDSNCVGIVKKPKRRKKSAELWHNGITSKGADNKQKKQKKMTGWEKFEQAVEMFDAETLLGNLARALSDDELSENMDYIARAYGVEFEEDEDEDEE